MVADAGLVVFRQSSAHLGSKTGGDGEPESVHRRWQEVTWNNQDGEAVSWPCASS